MLNYTIQTYQYISGGDGFIVYQGSGVLKGVYVTLVGAGELWSETGSDWMKDSVIKTKMI